MNSLARPSWLLLIISLPGRSAAPRMRVWRALKGLGAAVMRDGVYLLPQTEATRAAFLQQADQVVESGGVAHVLPLNGFAAEQSADFEQLFDRTADYERLSKAIQKITSGLTRRRVPTIRRALKRLRREFETVAMTDFFPGAVKDQVQQLLSQAEATVTALLSPGEPRAAPGKIKRLSRAEYRNRLWATRARPWVDRLASTWLIKRFIDPKARIVWLKDLNTCPKQALGFDFDGAAFTHVGGRVTFEVLLTSFGLEKDKALARLGALVNYLDVGGVPVAEAQGLEMILHGARQRCRGDDMLLAEAEKMFNYLYAAYSEE